MSEKRKLSATSVSCHSVPKKRRISIADNFLEISDHLSSNLEKVPFLESFYVYDPTQYARNIYQQYVARYCSEIKKVMFLGMNPGPWGMSQTGVPFGDVDAVKNWLKIEGPVGKPIKELASRPIEGFSCKKSEVSGKRFWSLVHELSGEPSFFFKHCFVYNYLPLQFLSSTGKNLPPTILMKDQQETLYQLCDEALREVVELYEVETVVGVGKFAETRAKIALKSLDRQIKVVSILHPSPRSKAANNWRNDVLKQLELLDLIKYLKPPQGEQVSSSFFNQ